MKKAFVIMPFDDEIANSVYEHCTIPICKEFNLHVERADEIFTPNPILDDIRFAIEKSTVIIADISGNNPNVFYELGMSHMLKRKQTIMITHDEFNGIPFDISHIRIIQYQNTILGKTIYEEHLRKTLGNILQDYKLIYKDEYELLLYFLKSSEEYENISYKWKKLQKEDVELDDQLKKALNLLELYLSFKSFKRALLNFNKEDKMIDLMKKSEEESILNPEYILISFRRYSKKYRTASGCKC